MTTQPYYPPQQAVPPAQPYPQQQFQPQYPVAPQAPQGYPQQAPQQHYGPPPAYGQPQPQPVPLATGTLDDYFNQPSSSGGPAISWKNQPNGTTVVGIVAKDVSNGDVQQDTDPKTGAPKNYRDGRPQLVMKVTLSVQPSQTFPEGTASLYVRGQMRDELVRAMGEAGQQGAPKAGAVLQVTLVERKPTQSGIPKNVFAIQYTPADQAGAVTASPAPAPAAPPQASAPQQQPVQQYAPPAQGQPQQFQQPVPQQVVQPPQQYAQAPAQPQPQAPAPAAPAAQQAAPQLPAGLTPEQQQLLAGLTSAQQAAPAVPQG